MNHVYQEYLVPAFWSLFLYHKMCLAIDFVYHSLAKEHPLADHLTSLPKRGVGVLWVFLHLTIKERPCQDYRDLMPSKQINVMYNGTTSGFEVLMAHNTLNGNMSPWAWCSSLCTPYYQRPSMQKCIIVTVSKVLHEVSYLRYAHRLRLHFSNSTWSSLIQVNFDPIQDIGPKVGSGGSFVSGCSFARLQYIHRLSLNQGQLPTISL